MRSRVWRGQAQGQGWGDLYSGVQYIMGIGHKGPPVDRHTHKHVKTLPSHNFVDMIIQGTRKGRR